MSTTYMERVVVVLTMSVATVVVTVEVLVSRGVVVVVTPIVVVVSSVIEMVSVRLVVVVDAAAVAVTVIVEITSHGWTVTARNEAQSLRATEAASSSLSRKGPL